MRTILHIARDVFAAIGLALVLWFMFSWVEAHGAENCYQSPKAFWAQHPGRHAYWHNVNGTRCWDGHAGRARRSVHASPSPRPKPASTQGMLPTRAQPTYSPAAREIYEEGRWLSFDGAFSAFPEPWFWTDAQVRLSERLMTHGWKRFLCDSIARAARVRDRLGLAELPRAGGTSCGP